jgi:starch synthase
VNQKGTGYCFDRYEPLDFYTAVVRATEAFRFKDQWQTLQQRGMQQNFSWDKSAVEYIRMYQDILGLPQDEPTQAQSEQSLAGIVG